jgi:ribonuclease G
VLRDLANDDTNAIRIDSKLQYEHAAAASARLHAVGVRKLEHYNGERPIFDLYNIDERSAVRWRAASI